MPSISELNHTFSPLSTAERLKKIYEYYDPSEVLVTSSFGTTAAVLLHHISEYAPEQAVYFVDTRYHFPETIAYRKRLVEGLGIKTVDIHSQEEGYQYTRKNQTWRTDPDLCCKINKVAPLEAVKSKYKVWISGLMSYQSPFRKGLDVFESRGDIVKFHPLIDWTEEAVKQYFKQQQLPQHPLKSRGFSSIGCTHCTARGSGRDGRWQGKSKAECGLHVMA